MDTNAKLEKNFISAVVYIQNHEKYIGTFIDRITAVLNSNFEKSEVIFVNDCGQDDTEKIIKDKFKNIDNISCTIINLSYEHKVEKAMIAGQDIAIGDFVYEFDTPIIDYDINEVMNIYHTCLKGVDIVSASPNTHKFSSNLYYKIFKRSSKNNVVLNSERFRIISRRGINRIKSLSHTIPYRKAIYFNCGLKSKIVNFEPIIRDNKDLQNLNVGEKIDFAVDNLLFFTNIGWYISCAMSLLMFSFSVIMGIYTLVTWIVNKNVVSGFTTIMMFLSIVFSAVFILITLLIKYLSLILFVNTNKQDYVFESVQKIK